jgi:septum formation protein
MHTCSTAQNDGLPLDRSLYILTADTTVAMGDLILGKPADQDDAKKILSTLSNQTHLVHTAVVLAKGQERLTALSTSKVRFAELSPEDIDRYIASQEPFGKAGAYGIQGMAAMFICQLEGSYSGVMGLPLFETAQLLKKAGIL